MITTVIGCNTIFLWSFFWLINVMMTLGSILHIDKNVHLLLGKCCNLQQIITYRSQLEWLTASQWDNLLQSVWWCYISAHLKEIRTKQDTYILADRIWQHQQQEQCLTLYLFHNYEEFINNSNNDHSSLISVTCTVNSRFNLKVSYPIIT